MTLRTMACAARAGVVGLAVMGASLAGCKSSTESAAGLDLRLDSFGLTPGVDFDRVRLTISERAPDGSWPLPLYDVTSNYTKGSNFNGTFSITTGSTPLEEARIRLIGLLGAVPVVLREVIVQLPSQGVDTLELTLSKNCLGQVTSKGDSTCVAPADQDPYSCQPATGLCGPDTVVATPVVDAGIDSGSDAGHDATLDAGKDAALDVQGDVASDAVVVGPQDASLDAPLDDASCGDAACTLIAKTSSPPQGLAVDSQNAYWSTQGSPTIWSCPVANLACASPGNAYVTTGATEVRDLDIQLIDGGILLWVEVSDAGGAIATCGNPGCATTPLDVSTPLVPSVALPTSITNDATNLYWSSATDSLIHSCQLSNSTVPLPSYPTQTGPDGGGPIALVSDGSHIFWLNPGYADEYLSVTIDAGLVVTPTPATAGAYGHAPGQICDFWTRPAQNDIWAAGDGQPARKLANATSPYGIVDWSNASATTEYLAWTDRVDGTVVMTTLSGQCLAGPLVTIATGLSNPKFLVQDGKYLYWTEDGVAGGPGGVRRMPLPMP